MQSLILWCLLAIFWSGSYTAVKIALEGFDPMTLVASRLLIGSVFLFVFLKVRSGCLPLGPRALLAYAVPALFGNMLPFLLIGYGELHVDSGLAALLMGIAPVATVFIAALLFVDEALTLRKIVGTLVGVTGLIVLVGVSAFRGLGQDLLGQAALIAAAFCYTGTTLYVRRFIRLPPLEMATGSILLGFIPALGMAIHFESPASSGFGWNAATGAVLYLGVFSTAIATLFYFHLVPRIGATRMQQINFVVPVLGTLFGVLFLGEAMRLEAFAALLLIVAAVWLVTGKTPQATLNTGPKLPSGGATPGPST